MSRPRALACPASLKGILSARDAAAALGIAVANADELHAVERTVLLCVKPAEVADADDRCAELTHRAQSRARSCE